MKGFLNNYYQRKIISLPQNKSLVLPSRHYVNAIDPSPAPEDQRAGSQQPDDGVHRLAILVDKRGWAYHDKALEKAQFLGDGWHAEIFFLEDNPEIDPAGFDLLYNYNHTPSRYDELFHGRLIKGLYSHYYLGSFIPWGIYIIW